VNREGAPASGQPFCAHDNEDVVGFGCPNCLRFEVRCHEVDCAMHGSHLDFICCWCGTNFFALAMIEHPKELSAALQ
jgi:hypothetical protein